MDSIFTIKDLVDAALTDGWSGHISSTGGDVVAGEGLKEAVKHSIAAYESISHQDKIIVLVENSVSTIESLMTIWSVGGIVVPVKRETARESLQRIVDDCGARYILDPRLQLLQEAGGRSTGRARVEFLSKPKLTGVDLALIIYTSGSTGQPKGIMLTHANVISALRGILAYLHITKDDVIIGISPLSFDYGLYQLLFCLATGCRFVLYEGPVNPINLVNAVNNYSVTVFPLVPALATSMIKYMDAFKKRIDSVRLITSTGGAFPVKSFNALRKLVHSDVHICKMYGLTESKRVSYLPHEFSLENADSVGIAMPGLDAKIFEEVVAENGERHLREMPRGQIGQLYVRGTSVFQQYFRAEGTAGAEVIAGSYRDDNWLATGDLFLQDDSGLLYFKGRVKELIKQAGFCIFPKDMEAIIYENDNVEICKVVGVNDRDGNEVAHLFVVLKENHPNDQKDFSAWLDTRFDREYIQRGVSFLPQIPLSSHGKIDTAQLIATI